MEKGLERYPVFAAVCLIYAVFILWLIIRRRVTLQTSLLYLLLMVTSGIGSAALYKWPSLAGALGFTLPSNLLFSVAIGILSLLHLTSLLSISRIEQRSVTLIQEVALLHEQLCRHVAVVEAEREQARRAGSVLAEGEPTWE